MIIINFRTFYNFYDFYNFNIVFYGSRFGITTRAYKK